MAIREYPVAINSWFPKPASAGRRFCGEPRVRRTRPALEGPEHLSPRLRAAAFAASQGFGEPARRLRGLNT
ncbi:MAG: hypothetical protein HOL66_15260 [Rhodospirillaceae bacterium]|nr:hypothetical protein [Rhodospirillaceae bacterium]MBT5245596.1 hypothetical protein [Rhodospirillaceae bacterium]MBT5561156.1 hypothetical protein [Rhodospirillaceae bacterium]